MIPDHLRQTSTGDRTISYTFKSEIEVPSKTDKHGNPLPSVEVIAKRCVVAGIQWMKGIVGGGRLFFRLDCGAAGAFQCVMDEQLGKRLATLQNGRLVEVRGYLYQTCAGCDPTVADMNAPTLAVRTFCPITVGHW